jgi:hypothetical protein
LVPKYHANQAQSYSLHERTLPIRISRFALLIAATVLFAGCSRRVSIESINHDPAEFRGHEITVAGRVANSFEASGQSAFELDDGTGRLWVLRDNPNLPTHNSSVTVTGRIEQGFPFADRNFVIILRETGKHK